MNTNKKPILIAVSVALLLFVFYSCQKATIEEPSPLGPSTISIILDVNANPNVIVAGPLNRQTVELTAILKKFDGTPISGKTIFFEVLDTEYNRINIGHFDGNLAMQSIVTEGDGTARTHYYGPLTPEVPTDPYLIIRASVAWEGSQLIQDDTLLYIAGGEMALAAQAIPDLIYATEKRDHSEIRATVTVGGKPKAGIPVYFVLIRDGEYIGQFADGKRNTMALTNNRGIASVTYVGPLWVEIPAAGALVNIRVDVTEALSELLQIQIVRQN
ncbi:MAG: hypothetical protein WBC70_08835 [Candidatus Aminicenantales bacterium]